MINSIVFLLCACVLATASTNAESCQEVGRLIFPRNTVSLKCKEISAFPASFKSVTAFECSNCNIPVLDENTSVKNYKGEVFNLTNSRIQKITSGAFADVSLSARRFYFQNNEIAFIETGLFSKFPKLYEVSFRNNKLAVLQAPFAGVDLDILDLSQNLIANIGDGLSRLKIRELNLSSNAIKTIPDDAFDKIELWKEGTYYLSYLDLSSNQIEELGPNVFKCSENSKCFRRLYLQKNQIETIKNATFIQLKNLQLLYLHSNKISRLEKGAFKGLLGLTTLELQNNRLSEIQEEVFNELGQLRALDISGNFIKYLSGNTFSGLLYLNKLNISHNDLHVLNYGVLSPLSKLNILDISDVKIHEFNVVNLFENLLRLRVLVINDNFWTCDKLTEFYRYMNKKIGGFSSPVRHFDVPNFHGIACSREALQYYDDLSFEEFLQVIAQDKAIEDVVNTQSRNEYLAIELKNIIGDIYVINCMFVIITLIGVLLFLKLLAQFIIFVLRRCNLVKNDSFSYLFV